jgi:hypothetical protein
MRVVTPTVPKLGGNVDFRRKDYSLAQSVAGDSRKASGERHSQEISK